ncbi:MAG: Gfo/Idh/MocA family oxidoreductase, partial [Planctomycetes bacterium]|nr:Gfo/Idh/MocA family oxidoreductase [Planctomycetota bacterium]
MSLNVAVIGCGAWGTNHVRVWQELGCLRVVCDLDPARLKTVQARYPHVEVSSDIRAVLGRPEIAAVVVATPAPTHVSVVLQALEAGKDVLVEKP